MQDPIIRSYADENLPAGHQYSWVLSMIDDQGDESDPAVAVIINR